MLKVIPPNSSCWSGYVEFGLEPFLGLLLGHLVLGSQPGLLLPPIPNSVTGSREHNVEVSSVDANGGSYLIPRSICSSIPNPKLPSSEKHPLHSSYSLTFRPRSRISSALAPRTVHQQEIFSLRRIPKDRTVYRALEKQGSCPLSCSRTLEARVSLSPDSPTQIFRHSFSMRISHMGFFFSAAMPQINLFKVVLKSLKLPM